MAWKYLLSPTFQVVNTAGKPATGGYIEVYIHGTRDRYYCASDFDGTLHPFKIPLDSLGANIVLADDSQTYDVYVYNRYGSLIMSRYDVPTVRGKDSAYSGDVSDATCSFTKYSGDMSEMSSGSTLKVLFTKISKFFANLKTVSFTGSYNDLSNKPNIDNGRIHRLRPISDEVIGETSNYDGWVLDLESQNESAPGGYDRLTPQRLKQILDDGEFLVMEVFQSGEYIPLALQALVDVQNENPLRIKVEFVRQYAYNNLLGFLRMAMYTPTGEESYIQMLGIGPNSSWYQDKEALAINGDGGDVTVDFTEAQTRTNIGTGEKLSVLFGKIKKFFTDLASVAFSGSYNDLSDKPSTVFMATYGVASYSDVEDAYFHDEQLVFCTRGTYLYPLKRRYSNKFIFEGTVDKDDGTFETITLDSSNAWTIETHSVDEYCVYRKSYDALHPLSKAVTAADISNGCMDVEFDLGNADGFVIGDGGALVFIGIPNIGGPSGVNFADAFTKIALYAVNENDAPFPAAKVKDTSKDDYGDTLATGDYYMWNRTYSGNGTSSPLVKKFRARFYLNMNTAWVPNLATKFYIYFTILL